MFCTNCGKNIDDDAIYCNYCGHIVDKVEEKIVDKVEEKIVDKVEDQKFNHIKGLSMPTALCMFLLVTGFAASIINIIKSYLLDKDMNYILGQVIFVLIFIVSAVLLSKSKKIGGVILILFSLSKMASSAYYYTKIPYEYFTPNLIIDEIFYLAMIMLVIISWKNLK